MSNYTNKTCCHSGYATISRKSEKDKPMDKDEPVFALESECQLLL